MQYWRAQNGGHDMFNVVEGNLTKSPGMARFLGIANAYEPGQDSILERTRLTRDLALARPDEVEFDGIMYDSLEAHPKAKLTMRDDELDAVIASVRGDAVWLRTERIRKSMRDPKNTPSESRRKWFNQITAAEDSWADPQEWDDNADPTLKLAPGDEIAIFFDGSKSDDATVLVACRIADGALFVLGLWQAPPKARRGECWRRAARSRSGCGRLAATTRSSGSSAIRRTPARTARSTPTGCRPSTPGTAT